MLTASPSLRRLGYWVAVLLPLLLGFPILSSTGRDDSHITYWSAHTLATRGEIVNYNGDRVEQSSSLTHVVLLAILEKITGVGLPTIGVVVSIVFGCLTVFLTQRLASQVDPKLALAAGWLTASSNCLIYWSYGGLESTLVSALIVAVALSYTLVLKGGAGFGELSIAAALTLLYLGSRPEAVFVIGSALLGVFIVAWIRRRFYAEGKAEVTMVLQGCIKLMVIASLCFVLIEAWRYSHFHAWFAQPVSAKSRGISIGGLHDGWRYLRGQVQGRMDGLIWILALLSIPLCVRGRRGRWDSPAVLLSAMLWIACVSFVLLAGGDWMEGGRFMVPILPLAVICFLAAFHGRVRIALVGTVIALQLVGTALFARRESTGGPIWARSHLQSGPVPAGASLFELMQRTHYRDFVFATKVVELVDRVQPRLNRPMTIMSGQMGLVVYWTVLHEGSRVRIIDRFGLTTRDVTACSVTANLGRNAYGTEVTYPFFFRHLAAFRNQCGLDAPDIIFDVLPLDTYLGEVLEQNGYTIIYEQSGEILNGARLFHGHSIRGNEFLAVRSDVIDSELKPVTFQFGPR